MYEQRTRRSSIGPAFVVVLVLLIGAASTIGYLVVRRVLDAPVIAEAGPTQPGATSQAGSASNPAVSPNPKDPGTFCPRLTEEAVVSKGLAGDLQLVMYLSVSRAGDTDAELWVCRNSSDVLIYQGHVKDGPLTSADNGRNSLLLAEGIKGAVTVDGDVIVAVNPSGDTRTEYRVTSSGLVLVEPDGRQLVYTADRVVAAG